MLLVNEATSSLHGPLTTITNTRITTTLLLHIPSSMWYTRPTIYTYLPTNKIMWPITGLYITHVTYHRFTFYYWPIADLLSFYSSNQSQAYILFMNMTYRIIVVYLYDLSQIYAFPMGPTKGIYFASDLSQINASLFLNYNI